eukprot:1192112-Prorocentrum_minimum.AAC.2
MDLRPEIDVTSPETAGCYVRRPEVGGETGGVARSTLGTPEAPTATPRRPARTEGEMYPSTPMWQGTPSGHAYAPTRTARPPTTGSSFSEASHANG